jgi:hypothetical protein
MWRPCRCLICSTFRECGTCLTAVVVVVLEAPQWRDGGWLEKTYGMTDGSQ